MLYFTVLYVGFPASVCSATFYWTAARGSPGKVASTGGNSLRKIVNFRYVVCFSIMQRDSETIACIATSSNVRKLSVDTKALRKLSSLGCRLGYCAKPCMITHSLISCGQLQVLQSYVFNIYLSEALRVWACHRGAEWREVLDAQQSSEVTRKILPTSL